MKLLLAVSSKTDIAKCLAHYAIELPGGDAFVLPAKILHHEVDILITGVGVYQATYKVTKALSAKKYHLALKLSFGNAYKEEYPVGHVLNIINEKPGDYGMMQDGAWKDHYDYGLIDRESAPHVRGGLVNMTNAYMNVFMPFKKSVGVSVNHYADKNTWQLRREKYRADCETGDGVGFAYPCLFEKQTYYHLCIIERNLATGEENFNLALERLNEVLIDLIEKL